MTDYFALLDQPRAPWLDPKKLKEKFHQKTLRSHPDTQLGHPETDAAFETFNEAYQVLQNPKRRLHHLLSLEGCAPSSGDQTIPEDLRDLFPEIGALTRGVNLLLGKIRATSNALSGSLLQPEILETRSETKKMREKLQRLYDDLLTALQTVNASWSQDWSGQIDRLSHLYYAFAYLTRWLAQLDEMQFQLRSAPEQMFI